MQVEQVDRTAAADLIEAYWSGADASMMKLAASYRAGHSQGVFVRAFATHREAARIEGIRLGLEAAANCVTERSAALQARAVDAVRTVSAIRAIDPAVIGARQLPQRADSGR